MLPPFLCTFCIGLKGFHLPLINIRGMPLEIECVTIILRLKLSV